MSSASWRFTGFERSTPPRSLFVPSLLLAIAAIQLERESRYWISFALSKPLIVFSLTSMLDAYSDAILLLLARDALGSESSFPAFLSRITPTVASLALSNHA